MPSFNAILKSKRSMAEAQVRRQPERASDNDQTFSHNLQSHDRTDEEKSKAPEEPKEVSDYPGKVKLTIIIIALSLAIFCQALVGSNLLLIRAVKLSIAHLLCPVIPLLTSVNCPIQDNTIIATAIPKITDDFGTLSDIGWYGSSYLLATCAFQLSYGKIYSFFPIKWVFLFALGVFELGSIVCGAAPTSTAFIIGRAIAGAGSAGLFTGATIIISYSVPLSKRPIFFGIFGSMYALASVAGPLMGGAFTDRITWRLCFYINLPFGLVTALSILFFFQSPSRATSASLTLKQKLRQLDPLGISIFIPAVVALLLALQWGGSKYSWGNARIITLLALFGLLIIIFVFVQLWVGENATVPASIMRKRAIWSISLFSLLLFGSFLATLYYIPLWFQAIKGVSPLKSGIDNLPLILATTFFVLLAGGLVTAVGYYTWACILASILMSIGAGLLTTFEVDTGSPKWIGYQFLYGAGVGLGLQQPVVAVQATLTQDEVPVGTAVVLFMQTFGGAVFVSVAQNIFSNTLLENVKAHKIAVDPSRLLGTGATSLVDLVPAGSLDQLKLAYNKTITETFYIAVAAAALSLFGSILIPWDSVKAEKVKE